MPWLSWTPWGDLRAVLELAVPSACAGCEVAGTLWCPACEAVLVGTPPRQWWPSPSPTGMPSTWTGATYQGAVRAAVVAWKEQGRVDLTERLAPVLRSSVGAAVLGSSAHREALTLGALVLVPAPSAPSSTRSRGWAPVRELARAAAAGDGRGAPVGTVLDALMVQRRVRDQAGLSAVERADNMAGAVAVRPGAQRRVRGVACIVVDDVVTTGATLQECSRALLAAGAGRVVAATVAATSRRAPSPLVTPLSPPGEAD